MAPVGALWEFFYPTRCGLCGLIASSHLCEICEAALLPSDPTLQDPEWRGALDAVARLYRYEGRGEQAVRRLKYSRATALAQPMSEHLARFVVELGLDDSDLILPVPIHWTRQFQRGFNQADLLCGRLGYRTDVLRRIRATRQQVGLTADERRRNLSGAFWASPAVAGKSVLLVDDVITSGHTVSECARTLKAAGAIRVVAVAFAGG